MDSPRGRHQQPETCEDEDQAGQPLAAGHKGRRGPTTTSDGPGGGRCHRAPAQGGPQEARRISGQLLLTFRSLHRPGDVPLPRLTSDFGSGGNGLQSSLPGFDSRRRL
jgi:hypothetical protein